jgi:hypothetical protein
MRLWSIHPKYLDVKGLVACWREGLLAKKCLEGLTKGYKNHSQLCRFKASKLPLDYINKYLSIIVLEAQNRGYKFNQDKINQSNQNIPEMPVTLGQLTWEFQHLKNKLQKRDINKFKEIKNLTSIEVHPLFTVIAGGVELWEKG